MMVQRWRISSNSQRSFCGSESWVRCLWWFKDEEFQAIHNSRCACKPCRSGVYDGSKMKNFKQFTTHCWCWRFICWVSMMVQRWRISSNSQQRVADIVVEGGCLWWFKDEEFQAIHNALAIQRVVDVVSMMVQRWRISSNSQPLLTAGGGCRWCLWWFKDEEFQAIHNT